MTKEEFAVKMEGVASILGMTVVDPNYAYPAFELHKVGERKFVLFARIRDYGIEVSGHYPRLNGQSCLPYDAKPLTIGISPTKTTEQIARDIERRLLPSYRELWAASWARHDEWQASEQKRTAMMQDLAAHIGAAIRNNGGRKSIYPGQAWSGVYKIENHGDDQVTMDVTCSADQAKKILDLVRTEVEEEEGSHGPIL